MLTECGAGPWPAPDPWSGSRVNAKGPRAGEAGGLPHSMKNRFTMVALVALLAPFAWSLDTSKLKPAGYVNDFAHVLSAGNAQVLETYCASVEQATGVQIAMVLVDSLEGDPVEDVANRLQQRCRVHRLGEYRPRAFGEEHVSETRFERRRND